MKKLIIIFLIIFPCYLGANTFFYFSPNDSSDSLAEKKYVVVSSIKVKGNDRTKEKIIIHELTFQVGDTISQQDLHEHIEKSRNNLLNISLFNYVYIDTLQIENNQIDLQVKVEERWYFWPTASLTYADRNFNEWMKKKDIFRINYGMGITWYNFRGNNEKLRFNINLGYKEEYQLSYHNIFLDQKRKNSIGFTVTYLQQNKLNYMLQDNKLIEHQLDDKYIISAKKASFAYEHRANLYSRHKVYFNYYNWNINDSIAVLNPQYLGNSKTQTDYFVLKYLFTHDQRDAKYYSLSGYYFSFRVEKYGLGLIQDNDINYLFSEIDFKKFYPLKNRFYFATQVKMKKSVLNQNQIFSIEQGLGYGSNQLQGFESYVINGQDYFFTKNILKYNLIKQNIIKLDFIPFKQFNKIHYSTYINTFFNAGFVADHTSNYNIYNNTLANTFLYSIGIGLDFVTYYDKVMRIECSFNSQREFNYFNIDFNAIF